MDKIRPGQGEEQGMAGKIYPCHKFFQIINHKLLISLRNEILLSDLEVHSRASPLAYIKGRKLSLMKLKYNLQQISALHLFLLFTYG